MKMSLLPNVEPGRYHGTFAGVTETSHPEYGPGARWDFEIDDGEHAGATVCRTTKTVASKSNTCGNFWEMVSAMPLDDAINRDTDEWVGTPGTIVVERSPAGDSMRVVEFLRDDPTEISDEVESTF